MNDESAPTSARVFILSIVDSEIVYDADRDEIVSRVVAESHAAVPGSNFPGEAPRDAE